MRVCVCEYRDVLQVQVLVVHRVAQLPDLLLHLGDLAGAELRGGVGDGDHHAAAALVLVQLQQPDHQVQAGPVQVHVEPVPAQDVHERGRAQSQVLQRRNTTVSPGSDTWKKPQGSRIWVNFRLFEFCKIIDIITPAALT